MNELIDFEKVIKPEFYNKFYDYWFDKFNDDENINKTEIKNKHLSVIKKMKINEHMLVDFLFRNKLLLLNALLENMAQCIIKDDLFNKLEYVSKLLDITFIIYFKTYRYICDVYKKSIGEDNAKFLFYTKTRKQFITHLIEKGVISQKK
jgi:hypothetical protein|tara:strand:- start:3179 stop:3625 length:447 start_codon:yes stop_codon:yes gene_type:complete